MYLNEKQCCDLQEIYPTQVYLNVMQSNKPTAAWSLLYVSFAFIGQVAFFREALGYLSQDRVGCSKKGQDTLKAVAPWLKSLARSACQCLDGGGAIWSIQPAIRIQNPSCRPPPPPPRRGDRRAWGYGRGCPCRLGFSGYYSLRDLGRLSLLII